MTYGEYIYVENWFEGRETAYRPERYGTVHQEEIDNAEATNIKIYKNKKKYIYKKSRTIPRCETKDKQSERTRSN